MASAEFDYTDIAKVVSDYQDLINPNIEEEEREVLNPLPPRGSSFFVNNPQAAIETATRIQTFLYNQSEKRALRILKEVPDQFFEAILNFRDDVNGQTLLCIACIKGFIEIVRELVYSLGATKNDINAADKFGVTPLQHASTMGHAALVQFLVSLGAVYTCSCS